MRTALFCVISQQVVFIPYRRFGTTYQSNLQGSNEDGTDMLSQNVGKELTLLAV